MTNEEKKVERERARARKKKKTDATPQVAPLEGTAWRPISRRYDCACEDPVRCLCVLMSKVEESKHTYRVILQAGRSSGANERSGRIVPHTCIAPPVHRRGRSSTVELGLVAL